MDDNSRQTPGGDTRNQRVFVPHKDVIARDMGGGSVLVHLGTNRIYETNATGARVWELVQEGRSRNEILAQLEAEFEVGEETLAKELDELLEQLSSEGLIEADDPGR
jgi:hypothetical protein